jgi:uncharacterized protein YndB with AHSA1/START domain
MDIEHNAPLTARRELLIDAPIERVWAVQADIDHWADWQPDVKQAKLDGDLAVGTQFHWKAAGVNIASQLQVVEPPHAIGWTGKSIGMRAVHKWEFAAQGESTLVVTEESLAGWMAKLISLFDKRFLEKSLDKSLGILKQRVESD